MFKNFKKIASIFLLTFLLSVTFIFPKTIINAQSTGDKINELTSQIEKYQEEISRLKSQATTLSNQIAQFDAQINLTTLQITQTEEQIQLLGGRIDRLQVSLDSLTEAFNNRASQTYKMSRLSEPYLLLISAKKLPQAVSSFHYLKKIQEADRDLLQRLETTQETYKVEKADQEELYQKLGKQKAELASQKSAKNALLNQTRSNEKKFQELLAQALAEKSALEEALVSGVAVGPVKQGDPIALVGNSGYPGCSTGKHLHFEVRQNNQWVNPAGYLQNKSVIDEQEGGNTVAMGSGNWPWPIQDTIRVTQHFGQTPYSWVYSYSGGVHTGIDMVSTSSDIIRAPADGTLYKSSQKCGSSTINIVYIEHGNGLISFYLHVQ